MVKAYHRPAQVAEALSLIMDPNDKNVPLAGGTTLALNPRGVDGIVDLADLGLSYIQPSGGSLKIGATTVLREIQRSEPVRQFAGGMLSESAKNYLTALIRNRATIGGILAAGNFWADIATVLVTLNASLKIIQASNGSGAGKRPSELVVSVEDFIQKGPRKTLAGGILKELEIPSCPAGGVCSYNRLAKVETDISILSAAAMVTMSGKTVQSARVAVSTGAKPVRLRSIEDNARGKSPAALADLASAAARAIPAESDIRASAEYRREVAAVLVRRLIQTTEVASK